MTPDTQGIALLVLHAEYGESSCLHTIFYIDIHTFSQKKHLCDNNFPKVIKISIPFHQHIGSAVLGLLVISDAQPPHSCV